MKANGIENLPARELRNIHFRQFGDNEVLKNIVRRRLTGMVFISHLINEYVALKFRVVAVAADFFVFFLYLFEFQKFFLETRHKRQRTQT